jgi:hypothetical protein
MTEVREAPIDHVPRERDMKDIAQDLIATALPYWEAEATIVRRFFKKRPTREDHVFWLKAQLWKELHPVDGYFTGLHKELNDLAARFPDIDRTMDRHRYHSLLRTAHARVQSLRAHGGRSRISAGSSGFSGGYFSAAPGKKAR